ncbi:Golgin subfamily A member 4, partial [Madurella mycetomatis]
MSTQSSQLSQQLSTRTNADAFSARLTVGPQKQLEKYRHALNKAYTARFDQEKKYNNLQSQYRGLQLEMEKKVNEHLSKVDEETFRNDLLQLQLDLARTEAAEHHDTVRVVTEKLQQMLQQEVALACAIERLESNVAQKDTEVATFAARVAEKDSIISHFEQTCDLLRADLRKSHEDKRQEIIGLETTISGQFEVILNLSQDLEVQKQVAEEQIEQLVRRNAAFVSEREAAEMEIRKLKAALKEHEVCIDKLRLENQSLEGDLEALIDMSIESEAIQGGYVEENKKLTDQTT